jgi:hypothetical protein
MIVISHQKLEYKDEELVLKAVLLKNTFFGLEMTCCISRVIFLFELIKVT